MMEFVRWRNRFSLHVREMAPHVGYAMQSGLGLALVIVLLAGSWYYARWLANLSPDFPAIPAAALAMTPWIAWSPVRTFVREADLLFLLPMERRMNGYFREALTYAFVWQSALVLFAWLAVWPLYRVGAGHAGAGAGIGAGTAAGAGLAAAGAGFAEWAALALAWIALKAGSLYFAWKGIHFVNAVFMRLFALLRALAAAAVVYALMSHPFSRAVPFVLLLGLLMAAAARLPRTMKRNWMRLAEMERRARSRQLRFFSGFVDVPGVSDRPIRRKWLDGAAERVPFAAGSAYTYLYLLLLLRTDQGGMLLRLALVGMFAIAALQQEWAKLFAFLVAALLLAVQGSAIGQAYRDMDWTHIYPLPEGQRHSSLAKVACFAHVLFTALLAVSALFTMPAGAVCASWVSITALSALGHFVWLPRRLRRAERS
jgi:ABC-2 type transport system permease protein